MTNAVMLESEDAAQIQQIRWVQLQAHELLVLATTKNLNIYSSDGKRLIHVVTAAGGDSPDSPAAAFRGIGGCSAGSRDYICVGVSTGAVCLVPVETDNLVFGDSLLSPTSEVGVVDVTAGQAPETGADDASMRALVCSANELGSVNVHALEADGVWLHVTTFDESNAGGTHDGTPVLCTSTRMRGQYLYCAYSTGSVKIFDLVSCALCVQITAHARWINALEVHPNGTLFATAAEDTNVHVWSLADGPKVALLATIPVTDAMLCGLAFTGGIDRTHVSVSSYDVAAIQSYKLEGL